MAVYEKWATIKYGAFTVGKDAAGYDVYFYGNTSGSYWLWDTSANAMVMAAVDIAIDQGQYIYLDGDQGGEYITSDVANYLMLNGTTGLNLAIAGTDEIAVTSASVTLATNELILSAANASLAQGYILYMDGQDGGEYVQSDTANELMLNATTALNLAIGGTDEVAVSATDVTLATNNLTLTLGELALGAGNASVVQGAAIYLDGQDGGEYLYAPSADHATLNATTEVLLAVGGNTEFAVTATTVVIGSNNLALSAGSIAIAQGLYIYLDGDQGGEYLISDATDYAMLNGTTGVNLAVGGTDEVEVTASVVTLATNDLALNDGDVAVAVGHVIYLDGQDGGEYLFSDATDEATLNATTAVNIAIGLTDEVAITASAVTLATNNLPLTNKNFSEPP